jgi:hypothetical protein
LMKTSKEWSLILATEVVVVALLVVEPALQHTARAGAGGSQYEPTFCCSVLMSSR